MRSVDGKLISKRSVRAVDLLTQASKSKSISKELALIDRGSARYDLDYRFFGSTSQSGLMLRERQKFRVDWAGRDRVSGHDVVVVDYQGPTFCRAARGTCTYREFRPFDVAAEQTIRIPAAPEK